LGPKRTDVSKESAVQVKAAIYARFSTEKQSEASIEDQFRVCERIAEREGFNVVARFSDAAISGGTSARSGYQAHNGNERVGENQGGWPAPSTVTSNAAAAFSTIPGISESLSGAGRSGLAARRIAPNDG
jgi:hypothetical protein